MAIAMENTFQTILMSAALLSAAGVIAAFVLLLIFLVRKAFKAIASKIGPSKPDIIRGIESGDLDLETYHGDTILYLSTSSNKSEIVKLLLEKGADVNEASRNSSLPVHVATANGNLDLVREFIRAGSPSSLRLAVIHGNYEISKFLVESGADINELYFDPFDRLFTERTPLDYAHESKNEVLISYLIERGAKKAWDLRR